MGHTACTEPQCLYKGDLYLYLLDQNYVLNYNYSNYLKCGLIANVFSHKCFTFHVNIDIQGEHKFFP